MKKILAAACLFCLFCGCSKSEAEYPVSMQEELAALKTLGDINAELSSQGWNIKNPTSSFSFWTDPVPADTLLGQKGEDSVLIIGLFVNQEQAFEAFQTLDAPEAEDETYYNCESYNEVLIPMEEGKGFWLFRQINNYLMGSWMADASSVSTVDSLYDSFNMTQNG